MADHLSEDPLKRTPLHDLHVRLGARMVAFAGYDMPVQYAGGIIREHLHTRAGAGLFDVSHMGQIVVRARSGRFEDAARALERVVPTDLVGLPDGRQRYTFFTNDNGGVLDDLMVGRRGDDLVLVVNAACKAGDEAHLRAHLSDACHFEHQQDRALIALQGPQAEAVLSRFAAEIASMRFMDIRPVRLSGAGCLVARAGYTGEDGFEISMPANMAELFCEELLQGGAVAPIGLGARDTLRLEAGLCLYGNDLDLTTTPVEAGLEWAIPKVRRSAGARAGGFPGADVLLAQLAGRPLRRRVGLRPDGRTPARAGAKLYRESGEEIGIVTSGGFGISIDAPVAMGYVRTEFAVPDTRLFAEVRGKRLLVHVVSLPFVPHRYKQV